MRLVNHEYTRQVITDTSLTETGSPPPTTTAGGALTEG
jgi:hypothetical protein